MKGEINSEYLILVDIASNLTFVRSYVLKDQYLPESDEKLCEVFRHRMSLEGPGNIQLRMTNTLGQHPSCGHSRDGGSVYPGVGRLDPEQVPPEPGEAEDRPA